MNNDKNKRENRKALRSFIPILLLMAVIGGIIGAFSTTGTAAFWTGSARVILREIMYVISPIGVIVMTLAGAVITLIYYRKGKKYYKESLSAGDEETEDLLLANADTNIAKALMYISVCEILSLIFFAAVAAYISDYIEKDSKIYMIALIVFIAGNFLRIKLQQMTVDFQKIMNPEKQGSVYDLRFQKKWEESCDELEKFTIYRSAYKAYNTGTKVCVIMFTSLLLLSFFFDYGPLPAAAVGVVWLVNTITYCREAIRLEKEKINL